jgi:hypothetical protein
MVSLDWIPLVSIAEEGEVTIRGTRLGETWPTERTRSGDGTLNPTVIGWFTENSNIHPQVEEASELSLGV